MKKLKGSIIIEATISFPIIVIVMVVLILSFRKIKLDEAAYGASTQTSVEFCSVMLRMESSGLIDDYMKAPEGRNIVSEWIFNEVISNYTVEDYPTHKTYSVGKLVNELDKKGKTDSVNTIAQAFKNDYDWIDPVGCDYEALKAFYDKGRQIMKKNNACKGDYEELFKYCINYLFWDNIDEYKNAKIGDRIMSKKDIVIENLSFEKIDDGYEYHVDITYTMHCPISLIKMADWKKTVPINGLIART